jgi:hypothetical protein
MVIKSVVLLAVIAFGVYFFHLEGWGADWAVHLANENFTYLYDHENIEERPAGILRVWQKWLPSLQKVNEVVKERGLGYENWDYTLFLTEINCKVGLQRLLQIAEYDTGGKVIDAEYYCDDCWIFIIPGSVGEALFEALCPK